MTQYAGRIGRPFDYVTVTFDEDMPDKTGALLITTAGLIEVTMKNDSNITMNLPVGILPGDFRQVNAAGTVPAAATIFAVLVSI